MTGHKIILLIHEEQKKKLLKNRILILILENVISQDFSFVTYNIIDEDLLCECNGKKW
jgi:hypothetical protein